jgi:molybdopterin/thiamine biosynthesis adenylyltransferase
MNETVYNITSIIIVGCGGIGSHLINMLTRYLASVKNIPRLVFVDGDKFEHTNLNRQEFPKKLTGYNKAEAMKILYEMKFKDMFNVESFEDYVGEDNVKDLIQEDCLVLSCVDNHVCRNILSKRCQELKNSILISGGNSDKLDGNVQLYIRSNSQNITPPIEERHPEIATTNDGDRSAMSCEELAQIPGGEQVIFANIGAAYYMSLALFNLMTNPKGIQGCQEVYFDGFSMKSKRIVNGVPE